MLSDWSLNNLEKKKAPRSSVGTSNVLEPLELYLDGFLNIFKDSPSLAGHP